MTLRSRASLPSTKQANSDTSRTERLRLLASKSASETTSCRSRKSPSRARVKERLPLSSRARFAVRQSVHSGARFHVRFGEEPGGLLEWMCDVQSPGRHSDARGETAVHEKYRPTRAKGGSREKATGSFGIRRPEAATNFRGEQNEGHFRDCGIVCDRRNHARNMSGSATWREGHHQGAVCFGPKGQMGTGMDGGGLNPPGCLDGCLGRTERWPKV
jgi:hypothetical protein